MPTKTVSIFLPVNKRDGYTVRHDYRDILTVLDIDHHGSECTFIFRDSRGNRLKWVTKNDPKLAAYQSGRRYAFTVKELRSGNAASFVKIEIMRVKPIPLPSLEEHDGYTVGGRPEMRLTLIDHEQATRRFTYRFEDERGNTITWVTAGRTKTEKQLEDGALYRGSVSRITDETIFVEYLQKIGAPLEAN